MTADGTTHVRALAYESAFIILSGFIGIVGLANVVDAEVLRGIVQELGRTVSPGPTGRLLAQAAEQGAQGGGISALLVWSMLSSLALHLGIATACTLSGAWRPRTR